MTTMSVLTSSRCPFSKSKRDGILIAESLKNFYNAIHPDEVHLLEEEGIVQATIPVVYAQPFQANLHLLQMPLPLAMAQAG